jgi:hypothetical protein
MLLTPRGKGGADLSAFTAESYPFLGLEFAEMRTPALMVIGESDIFQLTVRGADWHAGPYFHSANPKCLLNLFGAGHGLRGISGYDVAETTDESPERVAAVQRLTWAYLRSALYPEEPPRSSACAAFEGLKTLGGVESR